MPITSNGEAVPPFIVPINGSTKSMPVLVSFCWMMAASETAMDGISASIREKAKALEGDIVAYVHKRKLSESKTRLTSRELGRDSGGMRLS